MCGVSRARQKICARSCVPDFSQNRLGAVEFSASGIRSLTVTALCKWENSTELLSLVHIVDVAFAVDVEISLNQIITAAV